jgi:hypothetical protein
VETSVWVPALATVVVAVVAAFAAWLNARDPHTRLRSALELRDKITDKDLLADWDIYISQQVNDLTFGNLTSWAIKALPLYLLGVVLLYSSTLLATGVARNFILVASYVCVGGVVVLAIVGLVRRSQLLRIRRAATGSRQHEPH